MKRMFILFSVLAFWLLEAPMAHVMQHPSSSVTAMQAKAKKQHKKQRNKKKDPPSRPVVSGLMDMVPRVNATTATSNANALLNTKMPAATNVRTLRYKAITVYFSPAMHIPLCVGYELTATHVAMADAPDAERRKNYKFNADPAVKECPGWGDYRGSGYSRGHMAPAMDMRWDKQTMTECFLMTNICPQDEKLNNSQWRSLEETVRRWVKRDGRLIILTGPIMGSRPARIGPKHDIAVPEAFYKVVYAPDRGRAIAFIYANHSGGGPLARHAVTVDEVERRTGIDFFTSLPDATERTIESQCNFQQWQ